MTSAGQFAVSTDLSRRGNLVGIATTAAGNAVLVVNDTLVKLASAELPMSEVICLRALAAIAFLFVGSLLLPSVVCAARAGGGRF